MDKWKKELAIEALKLAFENDMHFSYNTDTTGFYLFRKGDCEGTEYVYLDWDDSDIKERFEVLKSDIKRLKS